jgi:hypothetical protein
MRKIKEVLRLTSVGLHQHQIARSCAIGQSTVHHYLRRAAAGGDQLTAGRRDRRGGTGAATVSAPAGAR